MEVAVPSHCRHPLSEVRAVLAGRAISHVYETLRHIIHVWEHSTRQPYDLNPDHPKLTSKEKRQAIGSALNRIKPYIPADENERAS